MKGDQRQRAIGQDRSAAGPVLELDNGTCIGGPTICRYLWYYPEPNLFGRNRDSVIGCGRARSLMVPNR